MPGYIDVNLLKERMYHEAFEKTTDMQRWDSGCWIRYKMFENVVKDIPIADVVEVVRCKECKYREGSVCDYSAVYVRPDGYCQWGEKEDE